MDLFYKAIGIRWRLGIWTVLTAVNHVICDVCSDGKSCEYGCCDGENNSPVCCDKPFWTWGVIVGISVAIIIGIILIVFCVLTCIYCKKKPTHTSRLRHTVSMRSNRIRPFPDLPPYEETQSYPYSDPPPKYEDTATYNRRNAFPQPQISLHVPVVSNTVTR